MAGGGFAARGEVKKYNGRVMVFAIVACLVAATGGLIFGYDLGISVSSDDEIDYSIKPEFYDPNLDDKDELWTEKQRKGGSSDAILSCPACFTTLCLDCQRHEKYLTQYRAMFVVNCKIRSDLILREGRRKPRRSKGRGGSDGSEDLKNGAMFRTVCCSVCSTEVGVFDEDEVYHFFHAIPSYS